MHQKTQRLEARVGAAMAAVRGTHADPERRPIAERALSDLHQHVSSEEHPKRETILSSVEQAREAFEAGNYSIALQHLSGALIAVTRT